MDKKYQHYQYDPDWIESAMRHKACKTEYEVFARMSGRLTDSERKRKATVLKQMQYWWREMENIRNSY